MFTLYRETTLSVMGLATAISASWVTTCGYNRPTRKLYNDDITRLTKLPCMVNPRGHENTDTTHTHAHTEQQQSHNLRHNHTDDEWSIHAQIHVKLTSMHAPCFRGRQHTQLSISDSLMFTTWWGKVWRYKFPSGKMPRNKLYICEMQYECTQILLSVVRHHFKPYTDRRSIKLTFKIWFMKIYYK